MRIGIDIGGKYIRMGIIDGGIVLKEIAEPFKSQTSEEESINQIKSMLRKIVNSNIRGIGIGSPSVVNVEKGIIYNAINIPSWKEVHLKKILEDEFNIPTHINNDSNCFAFGERYYGEGTAYRNIVCIILSTGLGAGIIINDKLYGGHNNGAGEIGCLSYKDHSYEYYCSSHFFTDENNTTVDQAYADAVKGDKHALKLWDDFGTHLGNLIQAVLYIYDPEAIILGGDLTLAKKFFDGKLHETVQKFPFSETIQRLKILYSKKEDIRLLGAAAFV